MSDGHELIGIDTNVILRGVLQDDERQSAAANALFRGLTERRRGFIAQATLTEVYWVLTRSVKVSREESLEVIHRLVQTETLEFDDAESVVEALHAADEGADFADALINATMRMFGATETVTFDRRASDRLGWRLLDA